MPDLEINVGGRPFLVSCQPGEEHFLRAAAAMLDAEAQPLIASMGRLPEAKMLLMAGLMLADRTAAVEDEIRQLKARLAEIEARPQPVARQVEVPVIPPQISETLAEIAARAEALAAKVEEKVSG
jgi:cell division protein ZapA